MVWKSSLFVVAAMSFLVAWHSVAPGAAQPRGESILIDDFESYRVDGLPTKWKFIDGQRKMVPVSDEIMSKEEYFVIQNEGSNKYLRAVTKDRAHRLILSNEDLGNWEVAKHPYIRWQWRANQLPDGAREDKEDLNDTGGALYVTFSRDWLGRPRSIKYSYSSTLPVGTVVSYGPLKVLVVSSKVDGLGRWRTVERNVIEDYERLFGDEPAEKPLSVMIWSDSNSVHDVAIVDFDNIVLSASARGTR